jgi:folate-binding protein YgfZ
MSPADSVESYRAATEAAALVERTDRGWIVVSGDDRRSYLHGLFSNDITALGAGTGCYATYLTAQGRMIADLWVYELGDVVLLSMHRDVKDTVLAKLDQFIFAEDVQLGDVTASFAALVVIGPRAADAAAGVLGLARTALTVMPEHANLRVSFHGQPVILLRTSDFGQPSFDLLIDVAHGAALEAALEAAGAESIDAATGETLRIEAGVPKFHQDMDEETIPLEAGLESRAISQTKGCYVGQEVIIRVLHRGHGRVARKLAGLVFDDGTAVEAGAKVTAADGKDIGEITSATFSPALGRPIALAFLHRDFLEPGTRVTIGDRHATVHALPFSTPVPAQS